MDSFTAEVQFRNFLLLGPQLVSHSCRETDRQLPGSLFWAMHFFSFFNLRDLPSGYFLGLNFITKLIPINNNVPRL